VHITKASIGAKRGQALYTEAVNNVVQQVSQGRKVRNDIYAGRV
jgi:hypothetical protein